MTLNTLELPIVKGQLFRALVLFRGCKSLGDAGRSPGEFLFVDLPGNCFMWNVISYF